MATLLKFQKWAKGASSFRDFQGSASVLVEHCPWMDFDRENEKNPEVKRLLAEGFELTAHIDGIVRL